MRTAISMTELVRRAERGQQISSDYLESQRNLNLAKELLEEVADLLHKTMNISNDAVKALTKNPETHDIGISLGKRYYDVLQYILHLESDEKFQQFY